MNNEFRVDRLLRVFHNSAGQEAARSKPFGAWPDDTRSALNAEGRFTEDEHPFLAFVEDDQTWTVVTLIRVVWKRSGCVSQMRIEDLKEATIPEEVLRTLSPETKASMNRLRLVSKDGSEAAVAFEPGAAFAGFWNVVKMMIAQAS